MGSDDPARRLEHFRHRTLRELEYQLRVGRLPREEYLRRTTLARRAVSPGDLRPLIEDLAGAPGPGDGATPTAAPAPATPPAPAAPPAPSVPAVSRRDDHRGADARRREDADLVLAIMSGTRRSGVWRPRETLHAVSVMGGVQLDLRDAILRDGTTRVHAFALMGGITIIVPPHVRVTVRGVGVMGSFGRTPRTTPDADAPHVRIDGLAVMGGVDVKVRDPNDPDEA
jgi:hypothetical protein